MTYATIHRRHVRLRALRSFTGLENSASSALVDARLRLRDLSHCFSPPSAVDTQTRLPHRPCANPCLSHAAIRDLQWWTRLRSNPYVGREIWPKPDHTLFTDASLSGWGAVWDGQVPASGFLSASSECSYIN